MLGESPSLFLRKNLSAVNYNLENPAVRFDKLRPYAELALDGVRQTGGLRPVVSDGAILN